MTPLVAALFVETGGVYWDIPGVDPWDESRDARLYSGPLPVVAHPPCARWGRYWYGGPSAKVRRVLGDDGGCFKAALAAVQTWGGVLEHPEAPHAFAHHGLVKPPHYGGWIEADSHGWACCVEQGHYGHRARKKTWLYAAEVHPLPELEWGPSAGMLMDAGYHTTEERKAAKARGCEKRFGRMQAKERLATPLPFRNVLLEMAFNVRLHRRE